MKAYVLFFILPVAGVLLSASSCSSDTATLAGWGEFCNNSGDCLAGLVCKGNVCAKPDEPSIDGDADDSKEEQELIEQIEADDADQREQEEYTHPLLMPGEKRLSTIGLADGLDPMDINGDYVVWCHGASGRLFVHCISEDWTDELTVDEVSHLCLWVSVDNGKAYTTSVMPGKEDSQAREVYEIDIATRQYRRLVFRTYDSYVGEINARNGRATWLHVEFGTKIGLYEIMSNEYVAVADSSLAKKSPRLSKNYVVWSQVQEDTFGLDVWMYDFMTEGIRKINGSEMSNCTIRDTDCIERINPMAFDHWVTWNSVQEYGLEDNYVNERLIWLYDINTSETRQIETTGTAGGPWGQGNHLFWNERDSEGVIRIRMMNITANKYYWITDSRWEGYQGSPKVSGRWLTYLDYGRFPSPEWSSMGLDVVLFDLCTLDHFKNEDVCR